MKFRLNAVYGGIHATYWMVYGVVSSFASAFLLGRGYNNARIGMILAAANIVSVAIQPFLADFADRSKKISLIGVTELANALVGVLLLGCLFFPRACFALSVVYVLMLAWHTALHPLFNSLAFRLSESGYAINFGVTRAMGSLFYAILCAFLGVLTERYSTEILPVVGEITVVLLAAVLLLVNCTYKKACRLRDARSAAQADMSGAAEGSQQAEERLSEDKTGTDAADAGEAEAEITLFDFIRRNKLFFIVNLGILGVYFSNSITNSFMLQIVENVGGTSEDMGKIFSFMAFLEIPGLFLFDRIHKHFSNKVLLQFAAASFFAKIFVIFLAKSVFLVYVAQLLQLTSFALFLPAIVSFTNEIMEKGEAVKGQALYTIVTTVASVAASLLGGFILDYRGASALLFVTVAITGLGMAFFVFTMEKLAKSRAQ